MDITTQEVSSARRETHAMSFSSIALANEIANRMAASSLFTFKVVRFQSRDGNESQS
jgi:hypothetical protein